MDLIVTQPEAAWIKLDLLAHGIEIDPSLRHLGRTGASIAIRKYFYNSPVWDDARFPRPQELRILGLVVGLNSYRSSPWRLRWLDEERGLQLEHSVSTIQYPADTIQDLDLLAAGGKAARIANLYGGAALAFFSPRNCYFFTDGSECQFCSLAGTAANARDLRNFLTESDISTVVDAVLQSHSSRIEQIMLVGGNMRDLNAGFTHHVGLARAAAEAIARAGLSQQVSIHVATMPPRDLALLDTLGQISNLHVMFNLEVWDPDTFSRLCPGKAKDYGRDNMLGALERLRDVIGAYRAHSLLVTGLESPETTVAGATALAEMGISPIINIYHSDQHSRLGMGVRPSFAQLAEVASGLQAIYGRYPLLPYWRTCGRNAIDAEAQSGLFRSSAPEFLDHQRGE